MTANFWELVWTAAATAALFFAMRVRTRAVAVDRARAKRGENGLRRIVAHGKVVRGNWYVFASAVATWMGAIAFLTEPTDQTRAIFAAGAVAIMFSIGRMAVGEDQENNEIERYASDYRGPKKRKEDTQ